MKRVLLHLAFWVVYTVQDVLLVMTWIGPSLGEMPVDQLFFIALQDVLIMLIPKLLLAYFILYVSLKHMVAETANIFRIALSILASCSIG